MQSNSHKNYTRALLKGAVSLAHTIAWQEARFYEEREDFNQAGNWLRMLAHALLLQGRYAEGCIEAERAAAIQPDDYERARALHMLAANQIQAINYNSAFITIGRLEEIARTYP